MTNGTASVHRRRFGIVLSAVIILAGLCLMVSCAGIYFSGGEEPYSREAVAAAFSPIAIPVYLCLAMILAGAVLQLIRPLPVEKVVAVRQHSVLLRRAAARADLENCDAALKEQILAERSRRKKQSMVCAAVLILCAAIFLIHALNGSNFHNSDINGSMIRAMWPYSVYNPDGTFPRLTLSNTGGHGGDNGLASTFWLRDGTYVRLKSAQLGYTFPRKWTEKIKVETIRFFVEGQNLFTIDGLPEGIDPESPGVNNGYYPQQRLLMGGITLTF